VPISTAGIVVLLTAPAAAHNDRADLGSYGGFGTAAGRCQRLIAKATADCIAGVVALHSRCMIAQMDAQPCDEAETDRAVQASRQRARDIIAGGCSEQDAALLQFNSVEEVQSDTTRMCSDVDAATISGTFRPALASGSIGSPDPVPRACMEVSAREAERLLRFSLRAYRRAFDAVAASALSADQKTVRVDRARRRIARARTAAADRIRALCSDAQFTSVYNQSVDDFLGGLDAQGQCFTGAAYVQAEVTCPDPVCGNGVQEHGEQCDDANDYDADGCRNDCVKNDCRVYASTFDLIQQAVFENRGCTNDLCHGSARQGGLDLRRGAAYANLVDVPAVASTQKRVEPGDQELSLLWLKLAAATLGRQGVPGSPMPSGLPPLSEKELEAVRLWIYNGAPESGVVRGTGELLDACLPRPEPIEIRPPLPPEPGTGVQLHMAAWVLPAQSESEVCFAAYYDLSDQVPPQFRNADGTKLRYFRQFTTQNPLSHHLVTQFYRGTYPPDDPAWGPYACLSGAHDGQPCNPTEIGACGPDSECSTVPVKSVACIGFGPPDAQVDISNLGFGGAQETVADVRYPPGVYAEIPVKGVVEWNSHAFNLAGSPGKIEAWVNFYFAPPQDQRYPAQDILAIDQVFGMNVPPFATQEICHHYVIEAGAQLFSLSSHMHQRGKRFRVFRGAFRCAGGVNGGRACSPLSPELCPEADCVEPTGRDGNASLMYTNLVYNDPVVLRFDPPLDFGVDAPDRTFTYCALYDNGHANAATVKRKSTSPPTPFPSSGLGGPCATPTGCVSGLVGAPCSGRNQTQRDRSCDSSPGAGDGFCDACILTGGVTTDDEMFVMLGSYYVP
jgi:cysteine-rich repeat protein